MPTYAELLNKKPIGENTSRSGSAEAFMNFYASGLTSEGISHAQQEEDEPSFDEDEIFLNELAAGMASENFTLGAGDVPLPEEETWYDALEEQGPSTPNVARQLLTQLLTRVMLLTSQHVLARATGVTAVWQQLRELYADTQLTAFAKAERLATLLRNYRDLMPADWQGVIDQMLEGFELVRALQRLSFDDEATMIARVEPGIVQLQSLLVQPLVKGTLPASVQQTLSASLTPLRQTIASLQAFAALPEGATFEDYLAVLKRVLTDPRLGGDLAPQVLIDSITRVEQLFSQVTDVLKTVTTVTQDVSALRASVPGLDASFDLKMAWLSQAVDTPSVQAALSRQLSPETLALLQQILPWFRQLNSYPADRALGEQAAWLMQQFSDPVTQSLIRQSPLQPVIEQIKQQFSGDTSSLALLQALLLLTDPTQSVGQKLRQLIVPLVSRQSLTQAIRGVISYGAGYGPVLDVWDWYQQQPAGLSWEQTLNNFIEELRAHPERVVKLLPQALQDALKGVDWLTQFPRGGSWQETLQWAAKSTQQFPQLQWLYNRFIELSLAKAVYGVLRQTEPSAQEEALRQVAQDLGQYWPGLTETGGGLLTTMIPLLPGLLSISQEIYRLPSTGSWLDWMNSVLGIIRETDSPALQQLGQQLESMIANRFVEGVSAGLGSATEAASTAWNTAAASVSSAVSHAGTGIASATREAWGVVTEIKDPLRFPGAEAAPITVLPEHILTPLSQGDDVRAGALFDTATESNQESLRKNPDIKNWLAERASVPDGGSASSTLEARTGAIDSATAASLEQREDEDEDTSSQAFSDQDLNGASQLDDEAYLKEVRQYVDALDKPQDESNLTAKIASGTAVTALLIAAAFLGYKSYSHAHADTQRKPPQKTPPEDEFFLNDSTKADAADSQRVEAPESNPQEGLIKPEDEPEPGRAAESPSANRKWLYLAGSTVLLSTAVIGGGIAYSQLYKPAVGGSEEFDESGVSEIIEENSEAKPTNQERHKRHVISKREAPSEPEPEVVKSVHFTNYPDSVVKELNKIHAMMERRQFIDMFHYATTLDDAYDKLIVNNGTWEGVRLPSDSNILNRVSLVGALIKEKAFLLSAIENAHVSVSRFKRRRRARDESRQADTIITSYKLTFELANINEDRYAQQLRLVSSGTYSQMGVPDDLYAHGIVRAERLFEPIIKSLLEEPDAPAGPLSGETDINSKKMALTEEYKKLKLANASKLFFQRTRLARPGQGEDALREISTLQVTDNHMAALYHNIINYFDIVSAVTQERLSERYSRDRAQIEAQIEAARLTLDKFAPGGAALTATELYSAYAQLETASPEVRDYLKMSASLMFGAFTGNISGYIARLTRREGYFRLDQAAPWQHSMMEKFSSARRRLSPAPTDFKGISGFKRSNEFSTTAQYKKQFTDYQSGEHINYESELEALSALIQLDRSGYESIEEPRAAYVYTLAYTEESGYGADFNNLPSNTLRSVSWRFQLTLLPVPGRIAFIQMRNGNIAVVSMLDGLCTAKEFSPPFNSTLSTIMNGPNYEHYVHRNGINSGGVDWGLSGGKLINDVLKPLWEGMPTNSISARRKCPVLVVEEGKSDRMAVRGKTLLKVIEGFMKDALDNITDAKWSELWDDTFWTIIGSHFVPFYNTIFGSLYVPNYRIDSFELMIEVAMVAAMLAPFVGSVARLAVASRTVLRTAVENGLKSNLRGRALMRSVLREVVKDSTLKAMLAGLSDEALELAFNMFDPSPLPSLLSSPSALLKAAGRTKKGFSFNVSGKNLRQDKLQDTFGYNDMLKDPMPYSSAKVTSLDADGGSIVARCNRVKRMPVGCTNEWAPIAPTPHNKISAERAAELRESAEKATATDDFKYRPENMSAQEATYYTKYVMYNLNKPIWETNLLKGRQKYEEFYGPSKPTYKEAEYSRRYEEGESLSSDAPYIDDAGTVIELEAKTVSVNVKGKNDNPYMFRVSDDGQVLVVDRMYREVDAKAEREDLGSALPMNELQGEFVRSRPELMKNIMYITQENIANAPTTAFLNTFGKNALWASRNRPIALTPEGATADAFRAMLNTPNVQPSARMLHTYPEIGKEIVEIRIQGTERITLVLGNKRMATISEGASAILENADLGLPSAGLTPQQRVQLVYARERYFVNVESLKTDAAFETGKSNPKSLDSLPGINKDMSELELIEFYNDPSRTISREQRGALSELIEAARTRGLISGSLSAAAKYSDILSQGCSEKLLAPQGFLLAAGGGQVLGQCAELSLTMAAALKNNKSMNLVTNLYRAAAGTEESGRQMFKSLAKLHGTSVSAHLTSVSFAGRSTGTIGEIVNQLRDATDTRLFRMESGNHAMMVGVTFNTARTKTFHYYDPNIGLFNYAAAKELQAAMRRTVGTQAMSEQYEAFGPKGNPQYRLNQINTETLADFQFQVSPEKSVRVRDLYEQEATKPVCAPVSRISKRTLSCTKLQADIVKFEAIQEATYTPGVSPERGSSEYALGYVDSLKTQSTQYAMGLDKDIQLLEKAKAEVVVFRDQLKEAQGEEAKNLRAQASTTYLNYLSLLVEVTRKVEARTAIIERATADVGHALDVTNVRDRGAGNRPGDSVSDTK